MITVFHLLVCMLTISLCGSEELGPLEAEEALLGGEGYEKVLSLSYVKKEVMLPYLHRLMEREKVYSQQNKQAFYIICQDAMLAEIKKTGCVDDITDGEKESVRKQLQFTEKELPDPIRGMYHYALDMALGIKRSVPAEVVSPSTSIKN